MMILCTGKPRFDVEDGRIVLTIPSGKDRLQVALTLDQAFALDHYAREAVVEAMQTFAAPPSEAEIVAFTHKGAAQ